MLVHRFAGRWSAEGFAVTSGWRRGRVLIAMLALFALLAGPVSAKEDPPSDPDAAALLPGASAVGDGWQLVYTGGLELSPESFRGGAVGTYTGPAGARVVLAVMLVTDSRVAVRRSWEEANELYRRYGGELRYEDERDEILDRMPLPPGCAEAKRIDGVARQLGLTTGIPMGLTLCAADPDLILLAIVTGEVGGLTGYEASDAIAALVLSGAGADPATPVAS
jgi:hypothetical protein